MSASSGTPRLRLGEIWIHPVKSLAGVAVDEAAVDDRGLVHDRRFMVVDGDGGFVTQREHPAMALLQPRIEQDALRLRGPSGPDVRVPLAGGEAAHQVVVRVWGDRVAALDQGDEVASWLSRHLGLDVRLVRMPRSSVRRADPDHARPDDRVSFADAFPFLLITDGSLRALSERLGQPADVRRFRPNFVVYGAEPFEEDRWETIRMGSIVFHARKACARCSIVSVDPDRGVREDKEPLATLGAFRKQGREVMFGQNLVHDAEGVVRRGDPVVLID